MRNVLTLLGLLALFALAACTGETPAAASGSTPTASAVQEVAPTIAPPTPESQTAAPQTAAPQTAAPQTAAPQTAGATAVASDDGDRTVEPTLAPSTASPTGALSEAEIEGLLYMHEEEKLAHDVYLALYDVWGLPVFQNIADSEATHVSAVEGLLDRYGVTPVALPEAGVYANPALQDLYEELVASGTRSLTDALRVGAAIEEIDILDLAAHIAETDRADIHRVYDSLTRGSENHLRAFVSNLERRTGETYVPQYLDPTAYQAIIGAEVARGSGRR
ncbi:MAG: DUF2202 domain-containing protein [Anaerolineae bacterium]|nr:DUF2202 domain-containing protein [Anaerolineae bacterium]